MKPSKYSAAAALFARGKPAPKPAAKPAETEAQQPETTGSKTGDAVRAMNLKSDEPKAPAKKARTGTPRI